MDLNLIRTHKNLFGELVVVYYPKDPKMTVQMIKDQWKDDPLAVMKTIGIQNVFALNLSLKITKV